MLNLPTSLTSIGDYAFRCCTSVTKLTFPESLAAIGKYAFLGCTSLGQLNAPATLTTIGHSAFRGCTSLTELPHKPRRPHHHYRRLRLLVQQITLRAQPSRRPQPRPTTA